MAKIKTEREKCPKHDIELETAFYRCGRCGGEGLIEDDDYGVTEWVTCWQCLGDGEVDSQTCWKCDDEHAMDEDE